jgi:anaerobic selenocysteine-containing dehydrogenase
MLFDPGWLTPLEQRSDWPSAPTEKPEPGPASRPELGRYFGELPCVALVDEIEAGTLRGLFITGGSPLTAFPDPRRTESALRSLDLLVVADVVANEHTALASHVIPAAGQLERSDLSGRGRMMYAPAVVPPAAERRPLWWFYAELARRLGFDVLDGLEPDACTDDALFRRLATHSRGSADELFAAGPHGLPIPEIVGWVHDRVLPDGRWGLAPDALIKRLPRLLQEDGDNPGRLILVSRREAANTNQVRYAKDNQPYQPAVMLHPADAAAAGVVEGSRARVASAAGTVEAVVHIDARYRQGVISMTHGWTRPNVDDLVSRTDDIDPLTGQPAMSGIPVSIEPIVAVT